MTDAIFIHGLVIHAQHGVMKHETEVGQRFVIDLELSADLSESLPNRPPRRYRVVFPCGGDGQRRIQGRQLQVARTSGRRHRRCGAGRFPRVSTIKVTVHKPHAPIAAIFDDVGITLTRGRQ